MSIRGPGEPVSTVARGGPDHGSLGPLRAVALVAVLVGAVGSLASMFRAAHPPPILLVLFTGWVLSPFVGLVVAHVASKRWSVGTRATLYGVMILLTVGSLMFYADVVPMPGASKPAFLYLVVPFGAWLLLLAVVPIAAFVSRGRSGRGGSA
jgi:hypothetical protein